MSWLLEGQIANDHPSIFRVWCSLSRLLPFSRTMSLSAGIVPWCEDDRLTTHWRETGKNTFRIWIKSTKKNTFVLLSRSCYLKKLIRNIIQFPKWVPLLKHIALSYAEYYLDRGRTSPRRKWLPPKLKASWPSWLLIPRSWKIAPSHFRAAKRVHTIGEDDRRDVRKIRVRNEPTIFRREDSPGFPGPLTNLLASKKAAWYASLARSIGYAMQNPVELPSYVRDMTCASSCSDDFIKNK